MDRRLLNKGRPPKKRFLGTVTTEIRFGPINAPLKRAAAEENILCADLIRRECGLYLMGRGVKVDARILNPLRIASRVNVSRPLTAVGGGRSR